MLTQLRIAPMGGVIGLDYAVLSVMFDIFGTKDKELTLYQLRIMEAEMLSIVNKKG